MGEVTKDDYSSVVNRHKIRRNRQKVRKNLKQQDTLAALQKEPYAIFFDGRIDKTLVNVKKHENYSKLIINEEHICILTEPGSKYVEHVTLDSGSSRDIAQEILECFHSEIPLLDFTYLRAIGCDGTVVNTGSKNGLVKATGKSRWQVIAVVDLSTSCE